MPNVLITGTSTGIGEACTRHLAGRGYTVYAGVRREEDAHSPDGADHGRGADRSSSTSAMATTSRASSPT